MRVLIIGGAGYLGQSLAAALCERGSLGGTALAEVALADIRDAPTVSGKVKCTARLLDISDRDAVELRLSEGWDMIFHLASLATAPAEANFVLGMRANFFGMFNLLEVCRGLKQPVPLVLGSWSGMIDADRMPEASHGAQAAIGELLLADYTRRGMVDGRVLRLPHVLARDDGAAHDIFGFLSQMARGPLTGEPAMSRLGAEAPLSVCSSAAAIANLIRMAEFEPQPGAARVLDAPAISCTADELSAAVGRVGGAAAQGLIDHDPDPAIERLASTMGQASKAARKRGKAAGLLADKTLDAIIAACR